MPRRSNDARGALGTPGSNRYANSAFVPPSSVFERARDVSFVGSLADPRDHTIGRRPNTTRRSHAYRAL